MDAKKRYLFECEECGLKFYFGKGAVKIHYGIPYTTKSGQSIFITYYDCPKCGRRHYVQVDDAQSNEMKKEVSRMFCRLSKKRLDYEDIPKKKNEKFKKLNMKLEEYRFELKRVLNEQIVLNEKGQEVELHFSM